MTLLRGSPRSSMTRMTRHERHPNRVCAASAHIGSSRVSIQNPFSQHYQGVWAERGRNPALPYWMRVAAIAFGKHGKNGHAPLAPGELAELLAKPDPNGLLKPLSASGVSNAIKDAKRYGFIAEESTSRCLVVPPHAVTGGIGGTPWTKCVVHARGRKRSA